MILVKRTSFNETQLQQLLNQGTQCSNTLAKEATSLETIQGDLEKARIHFTAVHQNIEIGTLSIKELRDLRKNLHKQDEWLDQQVASIKAYGKLANKLISQGIKLDENVISQAKDIKSTYDQFQSTQRDARKMVKKIKRHIDRSMPITPGASYHR